MAKKYEGSKADMANDKRMSKKTGMSLTKWESSKRDASMDKTAQRKMMKMNKKK